MKKYLVSIQSPAGVNASIRFYTDTPCKNYRVYYCGGDTGARYEYLGNAARSLEYLAETWEKIGITGIVKNYAAKNEIPHRGSNA